MNSGLLLMAVMGILFPAVLHYTHTEVRVGKSELFLSRFSSCVMLVAYAAYLFFQLKGQRSLYVSVDEVGILTKLTFCFLSRSFVCGYVVCQVISLICLLLSICNRNHNFVMFSYNLYMFFSTHNF